MKHESQPTPRRLGHLKGNPQWLVLTARAALLLAGCCVVLLILEENVTLAGTPAAAEASRWAARCVLLALAALFFGLAVGIEVGIAFSD
jgi:hypothetical protein